MQSFRLISSNTDSNLVLIVFPNTVYKVFNKVMQLSQMIAFITIEKFEQKSNSYFTNKN